MPLGDAGDRVWLPVELQQKRDVHHVAATLAGLFQCVHSISAQRALPAVRRCWVGAGMEICYFALALVSRLQGERDGEHLLS